MCGWSFGLYLELCCLPLIEFYSWKGPKESSSPPPLCFVFSERGVNVLSGFLPVTLFPGVEPPQATACLTGLLASFLAQTLLALCQWDPFTCLPPSFSLATS